MTEDDIHIQKIRFFDKRGHCVSIHDIGHTIALEPDKDTLTIVFKVVAEDNHTYLDLIGAIKNYQDNGGEDILENPCS